jgi:hypothetical protein
LEECSNSRQAASIAAKVRGGAGRRGRRSAAPSVVDNFRRAWTRRSKQNRNNGTFIALGDAVAYNPDEPRDDHGRWTGSGLQPISNGGWREKPLQYKSAAGRATALAIHAQISLPDHFRRRPGWFDPAMFARLGGLIRRWNEVSQPGRRLSDQTFRSVYLWRGVSLAATHDLRIAAASAARARTSGDMARAGEHLASAMREIGYQDWPSFLLMAEEMAATTPRIGGGVRLAQMSEEEDPKRGLLEEFFDPSPEWRREEFISLYKQLRLISPNNPLLTYAAPPEWIPQQEDIDKIFDELQRVRDDIAEKIAHGHGYDEHGHQFLSQLDYEIEINEALSRPTRFGQLDRGRVYFYYGPKNMLVIFDPRSEDEGSAYRPDDRSYYLKKLD